MEATKASKDKAGAQADCGRSDWALERTFKLKNEGKRELEIKGIYTLKPLSAACRKEKLAPGETADLKVNIGPGDFRGIVHEQIAVHTNDPVFPSRTIHVTGYVAKASVVTGGLKGAMVILPRDPVKLPGSKRRFFRKYEIANYTDAPIVFRCLSEKGHSRVDVEEATVAQGTSRVLKTIPGEKDPEEDKLIFGLELRAFPSREPEEPKPGS